jgi:hypothetical protein
MYCPPPSKRAREDEAAPVRPSIIKYVGPYTTPKQSRRDTGPSALHEQCENVTIPTLHGQDAAPLNPCYAAGPSVVLLQSKNAHPSSPSLATGPSVQSAMAGPSRQAIGQTSAPSHAISELSAPRQVSVHSPQLSPSSAEPSMQDRRVGPSRQVIDQPMAPYRVMSKPPAYCQVIDQFEDVSKFFSIK